jgi:hypothetical protein
MPFLSKTPSIDQCVFSKILSTLMQSMKHVSTIELCILVAAGIAKHISKVSQTAGSHCGRQIIARTPTNGRLNSTQPHLSAYSPITKH